MAPRAPLLYAIDTHIATIDVSSNRNTAPRAGSNAKKRVVLLGLGGAGKSELVRQVFFQLAARWLGPHAATTRRAVPPGLVDRLPVLVRLGQWSHRGMDLVTFLEEQVGAKSAALAERLPALLKQGRVVLLLDGLNEIPGKDQEPEKDQKPKKDSRVSAVEQLGDDSVTEPTPCLVTCRTGDPDCPRWQELLLLDLTREQIQEVAEVHIGTDAASRFVALVHEAADERAHRVRELARRPLFLLGMLSRYAVDGAVMSRVTETLRFMVDAALESSAARGHLPGDASELVRATLMRFAFGVAWERQLSVSGLREAAILVAREVATNRGIPDDEARAPTDTEEICRLLGYARASGLLDEASGQVAFAHPMFQEYLCARYLSRIPLEAWSLEFFSRLCQASFYDVWPLWAELGDDPTSRTRALIEIVRDSSRADTLRGYSAYALGAIRDASASPVLIELLADRALDPDVRIPIAHALGRIGDAHAVGVLTDLLREGYYETTLCAARALSWIGDAAVPELLSVVRELRGVGFQDGVRALGWLGDRRALAVLSGLRNHEDARYTYGAPGGEVEANVVDEAIAEIEKRSPGRTKVI